MPSWQRSACQPQQWRRHWQPSALATQPWETSVPLRVRMGLHVGPALAEGHDYITTHTLNRVARIMAAGHGGQVLLSGAVADLVRRDLAPYDVAAVARSTCGK